jgi:GT2 family glycosyltransferase
VNPVLVLTRNNLALTKRCVQSVMEQNLWVTPCIIDNGSTDGTVAWAQEKHVLLATSPFNAGVSVGWNHGLHFLFDKHLASDHVLVIGNDVVLPRTFYRTLLSVEMPFVTGVAVDNMLQANQAPMVFPLEPRPDFSAFLVKKTAWERVGPFDESMKLYAQDCDWHIRAHRLGINLWKSATPFYHERSSTLRLASPEDRLAIETQANKDRAFLYQKWGCVPGSPTYDAMFRDDLFGVDSQSSRKVPAPDSTSSTV